MQLKIIYVHGLTGQKGYLRGVSRLSNKWCELYGKHTVTHTQKLINICVRFNCIGINVFIIDLAIIAPTLFIDH